MKKKGKAKVKQNETAEEVRARELRRQIQEIRATFAKESRYADMFAIEKKKLESQWVTLRHHVGEEKTKLYAIRRESETRCEEHFIEESQLRERIRILNLRNEDIAAEQRLETEARSAQERHENLLVEDVLNTQLAGTHQTIGEVQRSQQEFLFGLKLDLRQKSSQLQCEYERKMREMRAKYDLKMSNLLKTMELKAKKTLEELEGQKEAKIREITSLHAQKYREIKNYFNEITAANLDKIKRLKEEIQASQNLEERDRRLLAGAEESFKRLWEPLNKNMRMIEDLQVEKACWKALIGEKDKTRERISALQLHQRELEYDYEVTFQQLELLKGEKAHIMDKKDKKLHEIFQKTGLHFMIINRQIQKAKQEVSLTEAQIKLLQPELSEEVNSMLANKNTQISRLDESIGKIRKAHIDMVMAFRKTLSENSISVDELGFTE